MVKRKLLQIGNKFYLIPNKPFITVNNVAELKKLIDSNKYQLLLTREAD